MYIGDKIRKVRELKGYKQEYVAEKVGLSVTAYGNIERNDASLSFERLEQIAQALEVSVQDIINIPDQINIQSVTNSQVGFSGFTYNNHRSDLDGEVEAYKHALTNLEKENEHLRDQNKQLIELLGKKT
jgi:transcriptional regulator with XRE-family HTH domain